MRFTEQELRDFLTRHAQEWRDQAIDAVERDYPEEVIYARGAYEAYEFVTLFLDEYRLEEATKCDSCGQPTNRDEGEPYCYPCDPTFQEN